MAIKMTTTMTTMTATTKHVERAPPPKKVSEETKQVTKPNLDTT